MTTLSQALWVLLLGSLLGLELIGKVPPTLHTPLMSGANAIQIRDQAKTEGVEDLRQAGVPSELRDGIMADSVEMMNKISTEEPEYICTPEMFQSSVARAEEAQQAWDRMRGLEE